MKTPIQIFWFRRDLRLEDNHGLYKACLSGTTLPIFIFDNTLLEPLDKSDGRVTYIHNTLTLLQETLNRHGKAIKVMYGNVLTCWKKLIEDHHITAVFTNKDYEPYAIKRDQAVADLLASHHISFHAFKDQVIFEENEVLKDDGTPYTVYTPYNNKWIKTFTKEAIEPFPSENHIHSLLSCQTEIPTLEQLGFIRSHLQIRPKQFRDLRYYGEVRDFPSLNKTSNLSVPLRFGTYSIRRAVSLALKTNKMWLNELIWRSFFKQILFHFPHVVNQPFKPVYAGFPWRNNEREFELWCKGKTGYPLVDAGMRELNETGYMHNRLRMVTASFLCKHLLIDWRWGEAYFANKLLDYDLSANNGNWQWAASTGCDAVPYFRIFNPETQIQRFDKNLTYIRQWVKDFDELTYPTPIIPHKTARERCLTTFKNYLNT